MASRIPRGYERNSNLVREFLEISEGQRPALELRPAQYLPVQNQDFYLNDWVVITAGTIVAVDPSGDLVNCNGGASQTLTYTVNDIGTTIDLDDGGHDTYVATATIGATTAVVAGNKPIGVAPYDYYQNINAGFDRSTQVGGPLTKYTNYQIQDKVAVLCDYLIEVPVKTSCDASGTINVGDLVQSDATGGFILWRNGTDDVTQIVGRCIQRKAVTAVDNLDKVQTVPGLGLSGSDTAGIPQHLYNYSATTPAPYASKMLIQLMVA
jgi:hypothetical protein